jgi:hypothetical protein
VCRNDYSMYMTKTSKFVNLSSLNNILVVGNEVVTVLVSLT